MVSFIHSYVCSTLEMAHLLSNFILHFLELLALEAVVWVEVTKVSLLTGQDIVWSVMTMLNLHAGVLVYIYEVTYLSWLLHIELSTQEHIKSLISFGLTVLDAGDFLLVLSSSKVEINTILVTFLEKHLWKCMLTKAWFSIVWVLTPSWWWH